MIQGKAGTAVILKNLFWSIAMMCIAEFAAPYGKNTSRIQRWYSLKLMGVYVFQLLWAHVV